MTRNNNETWIRILNEIERNIGSNYDIWFQGVSHKVVDDEFIIYVPNNFTYTQMNKRYYSIVEKAIRNVTNYDYNLVFQIAEGSVVDDVDPISNYRSESNINPRYTFDNFVVGKSNEFPHAAALSVAENPGGLNNPLFIYGSSGLGKTHLMLAIGNYMLEKNPDLKPIYVSSEQFTNELVEALRKDTTPEFRDKYRNVDLLLVDDIQFLIGKERIQEEFFHTFNMLHQNYKQIVVTSDKPPKDLKGLESRIITRLGGGLIADILEPDIETRIAILRNKNEQENFQISDEVIDYIAENVDSNIRELEGALLRVVAFSNLTGKTVDLQMAKNVLRSILDQKKKIVIDSNRIKNIISDHYGVSVEDLDSKKRPKDIAYARQVAMYLCREMTDMSLPKIGADFGGRDHTTVIHAVDKISSEIKADSTTKKTIQDLKRKVKGD
ncbi:chromosomal replication initiator protein DnaA [Neofamilia massiliensis]|uniref:chromosomal replication initiator protein DnaA n=1 Tax=Neofamilia massiliensis TaxID=1673724 RepID=UPI0006BB7B84|nr:chromosomal replication initiator protein DnaA [Neofamilia massiliensis]